MTEVAKKEKTVLTLKFSKAGARTLELWATSLGIDLESPTFLDDLSREVVDIADSELDKFKPPSTQPEKGAGA